MHPVFVATCFHINLRDNVNKNPLFFFRTQHHISYVLVTYTHFICWATDSFKIEILSTVIAFVYHHTIILKTFHVERCEGGKKTMTKAAVSTTHRPAGFHFGQAR